MGTHPFHSFAIKHRMHPELTGVQQSTLVCRRCYLVLYEWDHRHVARILTEEAVRGWMAQCPGEEEPVAPARIISSPVPT